MSEPHGCPHQSLCSTVPAEAHFHAVAQFSGLAALRVLTLNVRNVGIGTLTDTALDCERAMEVHASLTTSGIESFVLATCNRTEVYWRARVPGDDEAVLALFYRTVGLPPGEVTGSEMRLRGRAAADHLFRVCCGLESLVLGEAEILGQVRSAMDACTGAGPFIEGVVVAALRAGRLARAETAIGVGALSVASAAVQSLTSELGISQSRVLIVGTGSTGMKAARHLRAIGVGELVLANRTKARAEAGAALLEAEATGLDVLPEHLTAVDAVVCATSAPGYVITSSDLARTAAARDGRPLVIVDLSMPPAVEPVQISGIVRIDLESLEQQVNARKDKRAAEVPKVESVITRELDRLQVWARQQALRPLVADLRRKVEAIRQTELARAQAELAEGKLLDGDALERISRRLLEQVLAIPLATLEDGNIPLDPTQAQYLRRLFALDHGVAPCP
jgi:glutamyl-tRNA reductase